MNATVTRTNVLRRMILAASAVVVMAAGRPATDTPQQAALLTQQVGPHGAPRHVSVERTNISGRYAVVKLRGAMMEGEPLELPLLLKHFAFGWQAIELVQRACTLQGDGLSAADRAVLMRGLSPVPLRPPDCDAITARVSGATEDIEAVRMMMPYGFFAPGVRVAGSYAIGTWVYPGGGMSLFRRMPTGWKPIGGGGGVMGVSDAKTMYGVPIASACALALYDPDHLCVGKDGASERR